MLKPLDEPWMRHMLEYVDKHPGSTWAEIARHFGWRPYSCSTHYRILKMRKRGLDWTDEEARTTHVTDEGRALLKELT